MNVKVGAATDIGQVREGNEDSYLVRAPLYAVADGMGGHRGGEVASHLALETVQQLFERSEGSLADQVARANHAVFERSQRDRSVAGMGTTLTAALIDDDRVHLVHVGDSRAYLLRDGELTQLTEDHTLVHRMVVEGEITQEEAETHPHRSILTRALGVDPSIQVDEGDLVVSDGDRLLLCTDGLTGMVPEAEIQEIVAGTDDPQEAAERLVSVANRAGGIDNITALILAFGEGGGREGDDRAEVPHQPTVERQAPRPRPARDDITIVGAPIPKPPAKGSASEAGTAPAGSAGPRRSRPDVVPSPTRPGAAPSPTRSRSSRPARSSRRGRGGGRRAAIWAGVTVAVVVLGLVGTRAYLDTQWFVGVSNGRVAIFRGVPAEVAGVELHSVVLETSIRAEDAQTLALYRDLGEGITVDDREGAEQVVEQIRTDVARAEQPAS